MVVLRITTLKRVKTTPRVMTSRNTPVPIISTTMGTPHSTLLFSVASMDMKWSNMGFPRQISRWGHSAPSARKLKIHPSCF